MSLTKVSYSMIQGAQVNVLDFGADPTGVADSTAALTAAEAKAFADSATLYLPPGTYKQNGSIQYRCSISGYGATIINIIGSEQNNNYASAVIRLDTSDELIIEGITVDGGEYSTGFSAKDSNKVTFRDCVAKNCLNGGFTLFYCDECSFINCLATNIKYNATGLITADGYTLSACNDTSYLNCVAENFQRIGFVSEGESSVDSFRTRYVSCLAKNGNNCDRSPTEYNAGFWVENTNGVFMDDITVIDMAGNAGQTSARVRGITLYAVGDNIAGAATLTNFTIGDSTGVLPVGVSVAGTSILGNAIVQNGVIINANVGVANLGGVNSLTVENVQFDSMKYANSGSGGLVCDWTTADANYVTMNNCSETNPTYTNTDAGTFNLFNGGSGGFRIVTINNCQGISSRMVSGLNRAFITNSTFEVKSANLTCFVAEELYLSNCDFQQDGGKKILLSSNSSATATAQVSGCGFHNFTSGIDTFQGLDLMIDNCKFYNSRLDWAVNNDNALLRISNCVWKNTTVGLTAVKGNFYNRSNDNLIAQSNAFYTNTTAVAIELWNFSPDFVMLQGNFYTATALTNMTVTTSANNYP